jgi:hypothetical protein
LGLMCPCWAAHSGAFGLFFLRGIDGHRRKKLKRPSAHCIPSGRASSSCSVCMLARPACSRRVQRVQSIRVSCPSCLLTFPPFALPSSVAVSTCPDPGIDDAASLSIEPEKEQSGRKVRRPHEREHPEDKRKIDLLALPLHSLLCLSSISVAPSLVKLVDGCGLGGRKCRGSGETVIFPFLTTTLRMATGPRRQ